MTAVKNVISSVDMIMIMYKYPYVDLRSNSVQNIVCKDLWNKVNDVTEFSFIARNKMIDEASS